MSDFGGRDISFETLAEMCGMDLTQLTKSARGELNNALKQMRDASPDLADLELALVIEDKAKTYRLVMHDALLTPSALAKHWASLAGMQRQQETYPSERPRECHTCDGLRMIEVSENEYAPCPTCNQGGVQAVQRYRERQNPERRSPLIP